MIAHIRYTNAFLKSLFRRTAPDAHRRPSGAALPLLLAAVLVTTALVSRAPLVARSAGGAVPILTERIDLLSDRFDAVEAVYASEVEPIERVLLKYRDDARLARRVAVTLVKEGRRTNVEPRLLMAVLLVENPWLNPTIRSHMGATGLMQVMPFHRGQWEPCPPRLDDIESNICHGAEIFAWNLKRSDGDVERALLRYNGCVHGTNTPNCHEYPRLVLARARS